jgi:hypothetical protein
MKMPPKSASMEDAVDRIHAALAGQEKNTLDYIDQIATSGMADKRWCAVARTDLEKGFMAAHRALRDYPGNDPNQYGKIPLDAPLPKEFQPPTDMPDQYGRDRNVAEKRQIPHNPGVEWGDYTPDGDLGPPDRPDK